MPLLPCLRLYQVAENIGTLVIWAVVHEPATDGPTEFAFNVAFNTDKRWNGKYIAMYGKTENCSIYICLYFQMT